MARYTLSEVTRWEEDIRRSRFLALAAPVQDSQEALAFIEAHRVPEATHNCWAYQIHDDYRFFDDGEPGGTAGKPILQAIQGQDCDQVVVLVIRWFGGTKLGTGGLMRAYGGCAAQCLRAGKKIKIVPRNEARLHCPFADIDRVRSRFEEYGVRLLSEDFDEHGAQWTLSIPEVKTTVFADAFRDLTRGQGSFVPCDASTNAR